MLQNKSKLKINISDQEGNTPLMLAARDRNIDVVKLLLEAKAKTTLRNHNGESAYSIAISANEQKIADLISPHKKRKKFPTIDQEIHKQPMNKD